MTLPRPAWIAIITVSVLLLVGGTVWWLRARSVRTLTASRPNTVDSSAPAPKASIADDTKTVVAASDAVLSQPAFFAPEEPPLPGINIKYNDVVVSNYPATPAAANPSGGVLSPQAPSTPPNAGETDPDQDGLTNNQEQQLGTDPAKKDTDGDTLSDGEEVKTYRTDPLRADSDGDTYTDAAEIKNRYNPLGTGKCLTTDCAF